MKTHSMLHFRVTCEGSSHREMLEPDVREIRDWRKQLLAALFGREAEGASELQEEAAPCSHRSSGRAQGCREDTNWILLK